MAADHCHHSNGRQEIPGFDSGKGKLGVLFNLFLAAGHLEHDFGPDPKNYDNHEGREGHVRQLTKADERRPPKEKRRPMVYFFTLG